MLRAESLQQFQDRGLLYVPRAFDVDKAAAIREDIWQRLGKLGIKEGQPESWTSQSEETMNSAIKRTRRMRGLDSVYSERVRQISMQLADTDEVGTSKPLLLLTFFGHHTYLDDTPVPRSIWHSDTPNLPGHAPSGVIVLGFIDQVKPGGGGTMVVAGSHKLFDGLNHALRSKDVKRRLKKHSYFKELFGQETERRERFLRDSGEVEGQALKVVELTGEPGAAWFVDSSCLHTVCRNFRVEPRMMVRGFYGTPKLTAHYGEKLPLDVHQNEN